MKKLILLAIGNVLLFLAVIIYHDVSKLQTENRSSAIPDAGILDLPESYSAGQKLTKSYIQEEVQILLEKITTVDTANFIGNTVTEMEAP